MLISTALKRLMVLEVELKEDKRVLRRGFGGLWPQTGIAVGKLVMLNMCHNGL